MSQTLITEIGEFALIDRMGEVLGPAEDDSVLTGFTDDAAVYRIGDGRVHVATTDALIEAVHFDRTFIPMEHLGVKAMAVNVSDVVAMNAQPRYATIALGLPNNVSVEQVDALYRGLRQAAQAYGVTIVGGDTTAARFLTLSVTVIGEADEDAIVYRSGAQPGDVLCVTGDLGAAYAGLKLLLEQRQLLQQEGEDYDPEDLSAFQYVVQRQLAPTAQLGIIRDWAERGVQPHALIDISDGLASEVHHVCRQSETGALVYATALPIALETRDAADRFREDVDLYALFGGEDYELLFTLPEDQLDRLDDTTFVAVGEVTPASAGVRVQTPEGDMVDLESGGYQHFGGDGME
ncbi:MAG: thiamine-phosphate kinase [Bacteroidetes bacterium]|jgi:thiamine-monophosphate kinase|nr:thiamine-phosphate kinase [Bacteroidota bacterium]